MLGNAVETILIFCRILGPLVLGWAPNHFVLGAQLASAKKKVSLYPWLQKDKVATELLYWQKKSFFANNGSKFTALYIYENVHPLLDFQ